MDPAISPFLSPLSLSHLQMCEADFVEIVELLAILGRLAQEGPCFRLLRLLAVEHLEIDDLI